MTTTFDIDELERLLAAATPGEWQHHMSHVHGPAPERQLVCQFRNAPWLTSDRDLIVTLRNSAPAMIAELRELRAENARLRMANRSLRRGLYGLTDSDDADEIAKTLEAGAVVDWDKYPPNARAALGEPQ